MFSIRKFGRELHLFSPDDLVDPQVWPQIDRRILPHFLLTLWWTENFLARPHKDLGRSGPTCPFVRPSLDKRSFWLTAVEGAKPSLAFLEETVIGYRDWFLELEPTEGDDAQYKAILILLPDLAPEDYAGIVDATQKKLKPDFVQQQLMIGQFHPHCEESGVRNPMFRPLKCPVPLLAIRFIAAGDVVFMKGPDGSYDKDYLKSYLKTFARGLPAPFIEELTSSMTANGNYHAAHE
jgi:hypothetical protein